MIYSMRMAVYILLVKSPLHDEHYSSIDCLLVFFYMRTYDIPLGCLLLALADEFFKLSLISAEIIHMNSQ